MDTAQTQYTVVLGDEIAEIINASISERADAILALKQAINELPPLHRKQRLTRLLNRRRLKLFHGYINGSGVGFDYVEYGNYLHIVGLWNDHHGRIVDCVIDQPTDPAKYVDETNRRNGASTLG